MEPPRALPEGYEWNNNIKPSFDLGDDILGYCQSCKKASECNDKKELQSAIRDNYPYWANSFRGVRVEALEEINSIGNNELVYCSSYKNLQEKLIQDAFVFSDGVRKLMGNVEKKIAEIEAEDFLVMAGIFHKFKLP